MAVYSLPGVIATETRKSVLGKKSTLHYKIADLLTLCVLPTRTNANENTKTQ